MLLLIIITYLLYTLWYFERKRPYVTMDGLKDEFRSHNAQEERLM